MRLVLSIVVVAMGMAQGSDVTGDEWYQTIRANDLAKIKSWIASGANVNVKDRRGSTPLMHAAIAGSPEAMKLLLGAKAEIDAKNSFDATALIYAAGDAAKARMLVEAGADVNVKTKQGRTPLVVAASHNGNLETVRLLLAKGADRNAKDSSAITPLLAAAACNDLAMVRLFLENGVDATGRDVQGFTALHSAAGNTNLEMVKHLLARGANANAANTGYMEVKNGQIALVQLTPLMMAVPFGTPEIVKTLLDAGADVNAKDVRGMTPLMLAVASEMQDVRVARLLLEKGADKDVKSNAGETALDWGKKFGNAEVIQALGGAPAKPETFERKPAESRPALEKSVALLQKASTEFFKMSGCVGCHHQPITAMAVSAARARGLKVDDAASAEQVKVMKAMWQGFQEMLLQRIDPPGAMDQLMYSALGMAAEKYPADATTDALVVNIAGEQMADGSWLLGGISRSPIEESSLHRTAMCARALALYGPPGRKAEFDRRVAKARAWLEAARPRTTDDRVMLALGLKWTGASDAKVRAAAKALLETQRADGGWAQNAHLSSDAYATGQALYALHEAGALGPRDAAYRRGAQFLLKTQREDGSWLVRSRAPKFQPYFESGFPHGHDQWISSTATGWAVMGLAPAAEVRPAKAD